MPHSRVDICPCGPSGVLPKAQKGQKTAIFGHFRPENDRKNFKQFTKSNEGSSPYRMAQFCFLEQNSRTHATPDLIPYRRYFRLSVPSQNPKNLIYMQGVVGFSKSMFPKSTKINSTVFQTSNTIIPVNHPINDIHQGSLQRPKKAKNRSFRCFWKPL